MLHTRIIDVNDAKRRFGIEEFVYGTVYVISCDDGVLQELQSDEEYAFRSLRENGFTIEHIHNPECNGVHVLSRRFNIGNAGREAVLAIHIFRINFYDVERFARMLLDIADDTNGDKCIDHVDRPVFCPAPSIAPQEQRSIDAPKKNFSANIFKRFFRLCMSPSAEADVDLSRQESRQCPDIPASPQTDFAEEREKEYAELVRKELERDEELRRIKASIIKYVTKYKADPSQLYQELLQGKVVFPQDGVSSLVVNGNTDIVLPDYDETKVSLFPASKAVYLLFLKHPDGIRLKDIGNYREELYEIYGIVKPGFSELRAKRIIDEMLEDPSRLQQHISRIRRAFKLIIVGEQLDLYCITGDRGETYSIKLDRSKVTLPRVFY